MTDIYDTTIKNAIADHLTGVDWRLLKAQLMAESALNPKALSKVGAEGIAQFMPETWHDVMRDMGLQSKEYIRTDAYIAIPACAHYMNQLYGKWTAPRPDADRYCLALASYNAGFGNLITAQKLALGANDYKTIISNLHLVTGAKNAKETRDYVRRIFGYFYGYLLG